MSRRLTTARFQLYHRAAGTSGEASEQKDCLQGGMVCLLVLLSLPCLLTITMLCDTSSQLSELSCDLQRDFPLRPWKPCILDLLDPNMKFLLPKVVLPARCVSIVADQFAMSPSRSLSEARKDDDLH